jgi:hypothetical protein
MLRKCEILAWCVTPAFGSGFPNLEKVGLILTLVA